MAAPMQLEPAGARGDLGPADRPEAWRWVATAVVGVIVGYAMALVLATIGVAIAGTHGGVAAITKLAVPPVWFVVVELAGLWVGFGGAAWVVTRSGHHVGFSFRRADVWYVFLGLALQIVVWACYLPVHAKGMSKPVTHLLGGGSGWVLVIPAVMTIVGAPVFEELFFRGVLLRAFVVLFRTRRAAMGVVAAVVLDASLFGLAHLGNDSWIQLPGLVGIGVVLATLAIRTGRLGPSIMTHASFNALAVLVFAAQR